jgi:flagellar biosynthesis protein FliR
MSAADLTSLLPLAAAASLVLSRALGATATGCGLPGLDVRVRVGVGLALALIVGPVVGPSLASRVPMDPIGLGLAVAAEAAIGLGLGLATGLIVSAARQAGDLIGVQAGLSPMVLLDPLDPEAAGSTSLGQLHGWLALVAFVALGGPVAGVDGLIGSYHALPAAAWRPDPSGLSPLLERMGEAVGLAVRAASPGVLALLAAGVVMTLLGRAGAGMGLLALALPVRWGVGVGATILTLGVAASLYGDAWARFLLGLSGGSGP